MQKYEFTKVQWYFIQLVCWAALFDSFVLFEETVIDRSSWKRSIPGYRIGEACVWDLIAAFAIAVLVILLFRRRRPPDA